MDLHSATVSDSRHVDTSTQEERFCVCLKLQACRAGEPYTALTCKRTAWISAQEPTVMMIIRHRNDVCAKRAYLLAKQVIGMRMAAPALVHCLGRFAADEGHLQAGCPEDLLRLRIRCSPAGSFQLYLSLAGLASGHALLQYKSRAASNQTKRFWPLPCFTCCRSRQG